ncbi:MAG: hypothetical protein JWM11_1058 [Planctomycetaceae bacterium]|nr:hypothetical protein [Planctomycetaceae bacterium]
MSTGSANILTPNQRRWLNYLTVSTLLIGGFMLWLDDELRTKGARLGSVSLELAGSNQAAKHVLNGWSSQQRIIAAIGLGFDFVFIANYSVWLYLGCLWSAERWLSGNANRARQLQLAAWLAIGAGGFDVVENFVLFDFIHSGGKSPAYPIAFWCATIKFVLLGIVLIGVGSGLLAGGAAEKKPTTVPVPVPVKK